MACMEPAAEESLAAMRARSKFGIAMAAMTRIIATTINNSINEKPFCFAMSCIPSVAVGLDKACRLERHTKAVALHSPCPSIHVRRIKSVEPCPFDQGPFPATIPPWRFLPTIERTKGGEFASAALWLCTLPQVLRQIQAPVLVVHRAQSQA